jgi:hypothetical protein
VVGRIVSFVSQVPMVCLRPWRHLLLASSYTVDLHAGRSYGLPETQAHWRHSPAPPTVQALPTLHCSMQSLQGVASRNWAPLAPRLPTPHSQSAGCQRPSCQYCGWNRWGPRPLQRGSVAKSPHLLLIAILNDDPIVTSVRPMAQLLLGTCSR